MDKLEQYLDQVCRGIGGPVEMRAHVRQELREHLLDAVAQHKAAGMAEADAIAKALAEFGKPDEVRFDLEAAHGQRMTWLIDKAMQWKEKTMKAKWLWVSWAYVGLGLMIALQALFITFTVVFLIPRFKKLMTDGIIDPDIMNDVEPRRMVNFLHELSYVAGNHTLLLLVVPALLWALFEWRVKSENKTFMRLSALGTAAVALTLVVIFMAGSMIICFELGAPAMGRIARPFALEQVSKIDNSLAAFEQALAKKDRNMMEEHAGAALTAANFLSGSAARSLTLENDNAKIEELRGQVRGVRHFIAELQKALPGNDAEKIQAALNECRKAFAPVREAAKKPVN